MTTHPSMLLSESLAGPESESLYVLLESGSLSAENALSLVRQIAAVLDGLHAQQRVHGGLRPSLITVDGRCQVSISPDSGTVTSADRTEALLHLAQNNCVENRLPQDRTNSR